MEIVGVVAQEHDICRRQVCSTTVEYCIGKIVVFFWPKGTELGRLVCCWMMIGVVMDRRLARLGGTWFTCMKEGFTQLWMVSVLYQKLGMDSQVCGKKMRCYWHCAGELGSGSSHLLLGNWQMAKTNIEFMLVDSSQISHRSHTMSHLHSNQLEYHFLSCRSCNRGNTCPSNHT